MSIWLLIAAVLLAWALVSAATALWLRRLLSARRRGGTIDFTPFAGVPYDQETRSPRLTIQEMVDDYPGRSLGAGGHEAA